MLKVLTVLVTLAVSGPLGVPVVERAAQGERRMEATLVGVRERENQNASIAALGRFVALAWTATAGKTTDVFVTVSADGAAFGPPRRANDKAGDALAGGEQAPRVTLHSTSASRDPFVTVVWASHLQGSAIRFARSRDGGRTFAPAEDVSPRGAAGHRGWPAATCAAGRTNVVWLDHGNGSWLKSRSMSLTEAPSSPTSVAHGVCYCCKTAVAAGPGGLYAAWRHVYPGNIRDIAVAASRDGGATFGTPVRVSEDGWEINGCPDDGPAIAVDAAGIIHVVWPTVVAGARKVIFYATSHDGRTFTPRREVPGLGSGSSSHPQIAVARDGRVAIVWDEKRDIGFVELAEGRFSTPVVLDDNQTDSSYPVSAYTPDGLVVAWSAHRLGASSIAVNRLSTGRG